MRIAKRICLHGLAVSVLTTLSCGFQSAQQTGRSDAAENGAPVASTDGGIPSNTDGGFSVPDNVSSDGGVRVQCPFLLCEGFENGILGRAPNSPFEVDLLATSGVTLDNTRASSGTQSVLVRAESGFFESRSAMLSLKTRAPVSLSGGAWYGRANFWAGPGFDTVIHNTLIVASGQLDGKEAGFQLSTTFGSVMGEYYSGTCTDCLATSDTRFPLEKWVCVEWMFDDVSNEGRFWIDSKEVGKARIVRSMTSRVEWPAPRFDRLRIGFRSYPFSGGAPISLWVDDIALGTNRIGCQ